MHDLKQKGDDFCCKNSTKKDEPQVTNYDEVANLKGIIEELKRTLSKSMYALQENEELMKDKERLDWLVDNTAISMLRKDEDGEEWWVELDYSEARNDIDKQMEEAQWLKNFK